MDAFYPFIYQPQDKEEDNFEQISLYIEDDRPIKQVVEEPEEIRVIVLDIL